MAVSKVILNGETLMDVTVDTVTSENLLSGYQATRRDGQKVQGSYVPSSASFTTGSAEPSEDSQHITPPSGYDGFSYFDVGAIDSNYVGSNVPARDTNDLSASGSVVTVPSGYYSSQVVKAIPAGSATTPATTIETIPEITVDSSGLVTSTVNGSENITPTVVAGYISTGTTGVVTVSGDSNLQLSIQAAKTVTPREYLQTAVASGKYTTGNVTIAAISSDYVGSNISQHKASDVTQRYWAYSSNELYGYATCNVTVPSGYYASEGNMAFTQQIAQINNIPKIASTTIIPTESSQAAVSKFTWTTGDITVAAIDSNYVGSNVAQRSGLDLSASGSIVTVPSGYYSSEATKAVSAGSATTPAKTISVTPTISINTSTGIITSTAAGSSSITPTVSAGYVNSGIAGTVSVSGTNTSQLSTQATKTVTPTESEQTAVEANKYTTGVVKVAAIPSDYIGSAIASVDVVEGTTTVSGSTATRGVATWSAGIIPSGQMNAATFANSSSAQTQYVDISNTTDAPVLVSGGYLYINKGYTDDLKISLAKLVPDGASADLASDKILSGYAAYNNDGTLIAGNIPSKSSNDVAASGSVVSVPSGYYSTAVSTNIAAGSAKVNNTDLVRTPNLTLDNAVGIVTATIPYRQTGVSAALTSGYIDSVTNGNIGVTGSSSLQLSVVSGSTITPTESTQIAVASGSYTLGDVKIAAISSDYIGSNITQRSSSDLGASGSIVTVPSGYYSAEASKSIAEGTVAIDSGNRTITPEVSLNTTTGVITATNNNYLTIGAAVTSGYISSVASGIINASGTSNYALSTQAAATITPTESSQTAVASGKYTTGPVTVAAISSTYVGSGIAQKSSADLTASGSVITAPAGYYAAAASKSISAGSATTPAKTIAITPSISIDSSTGVITATAAGSSSITPTVSAGYISSGTAGTVSVSGSNTSALSTQGAATITPTESVQTAVASGKYTVGTVQVGAISSDYIGSNIAQRSSSDLSASGSIVTVPSGYYTIEATKAVAAGALKTAPIEIPLMPTFSVDSNGLVTAQQSTTTQFSPIFTPGYIDSGYMNANVAGSSTYQLTTASASTYTPSSSTQSIPSGVYLTGVQTIAGDSNFVSDNIVEGITIFGLTGTAPGFEPMTAEEIWVAAASGWGSTNPSMSAAIWSAVAAGWSVNATMTDAQIGAAVASGWR